MRFRISYLLKARALRLINLKAGWWRSSLRAAGFSGLLFLLAACSGSTKLSPLAPGSTIVAFGDSLTFGTGVDATHSYPAVLAQLSGLNVIRSGVPGEISAAGLKRLPGVLDEHNPRLVIICHGGNDVLRQLSADKTEQNLRAMISLVQNSGAEVLIVAVPKFGLFPTAWAYYEKIAEDLDVPVEFDVISDLQRDPGKKSDQVHFNQAGYRLMAEAIADLLKDSGAL